MAKKARSTSNFVPQKMGKNVVDRTSQLPDDIVIMILSRLSMREAARTSVLSQRWKNLWKFTTGSLDFDASSSYIDLRDRKKSLVIERSKYSSWVNQVLQSHQGTSIDEFRVCFDMDITSSSHIDSWVHFALEKGVSRFELDLTGVWGLFKDERAYTFSVKRMPFSTNSRPLDFSGFCSLTSFSLKYVNVSNEVVEHILSNCPLLKCLCISGASNIVNLKVINPSLKLEHLEISDCFRLVNLEISASNLLSFTYFGSKIDIPLQSFPKLSKLSIGSKFCEYIVFEFHEHSRHLSQIETLKLQLGEPIFLKSCCLPVKFPRMRNLTQLELQITAPRDQSVICYTTLIKASPVLRRVVIELILKKPSFQSQERSSYVESKFREVTRHPHKCLEVVEMAGFVGCAADTELALYFLKNAVSLNKLIIDPNMLDLCGGPRDLVETKGKRAARKRARQLDVPSGVELVVL